MISAAHTRAATPAGADVAFLVGAGRSGTTLLYKLLCLHPQVAYISNYENRLPWFPDGVACGAVSRSTSGKLAAWFRKGGNAYFVSRPWMKRLFPTPHEGESVFAACGMPLFLEPGYCPDPHTVESLRGRFAAIRRRAGAQVFVSKRTANNRRIPQLAQVFPAARWLHLVRDGREVAQSLSTVEWWDSHRVWWDGRTALEIERGGEPRLAICARNWVREMQELEVALAMLDRNHVLELRYEDLLREPLVVLEKALRFMGLEMTVDYREAVHSLGLRPVAPKWRSGWAPSDLARVLHEAAPMLRDLGYTD